MDGPGANLEFSPCAHANGLVRTESTKNSLHIPRRVYSSLLRNLQLLYWLRGLESMGIK